MQNPMVPNPDISTGELTIDASEDRKLYVCLAHLVLLQIHGSHGSHASHSRPIMMAPMVGS